VRLSVIKCISIIFKNGGMGSYCSLFLRHIFLEDKPRDRECTGWARALALFSIACANFRSRANQWNLLIATKKLYRAIISDENYYLLHAIYVPASLPRFLHDIPLNGTCIDTSIEHASYRYYSLNIAAKHEYIKCDKILSYVSQ